MLASKQLFQDLIEAPDTRSPIIDLDTAARLRVAVGRLSRRLRPTIAGSEAGLTATRISVLLTVVRLGPMRLSELAAIERLNPTMLSRLVADLVARGLHRPAPPIADDRRAAGCSTTLAGRRLRKRIHRERADAINAVLGGIERLDASRLPGC